MIIFSSFYNTNELSVLLHLIFGVYIQRGIHKGGFLPFNIWLYLLSTFKPTYAPIKGRA